MLKEYAVFAKIALILTLVFGVLMGLNHLYDSIKDSGRAEVQGLWDNDKLNQEIIIKNMLATAKETADKVHNGTIIYYEQELQNAKRDYDKRIADAKSNGGLRVPKTPCRAMPASEPTITTSPKGDYEASTDRLPERIESGLYALAGKCQAVVIQLSSCQKWITDSGMNKETPIEN